MTKLEDLKQNVLRQANLESLVGENHSLIKRAGRVSTRCPFHSEKTPSFYIYGDHYHCFGCGAHGDVISYVQHQQGLGFIEALKWLASRYGIDASALERSPRDREFWNKTVQIGKALLAAQSYFVRQLDTPAGKSALNYLARRGFKAESIKTFGFGYALDTPSQLTDQLLREGFELDHLIESSLTNTFQGRNYDFFRHRLTIPIRDVQGKLVAFGGRTLSNHQQKYKNSRYDKGKILFGFDTARTRAKKQQRIIVVEGYLDALKLSQAGLGEVVACQGTSLSVDHIKYLKSAAPNIHLLFDGDKAGRNASLKLIEASMDHPELAFFVTELPPGEDPDSYIEKHGLEKLEALISASKSLLVYGFTKRLEQAHVGGVPGIVSQEFLPWLSKVTDPIKKSYLLETLAGMTQIKRSDLEKGLEQSLAKEQQNNPRQSTPSNHETAVTDSRVDSIQRTVLRGKAEENRASHQNPEPLSGLAYELTGHLYFSDGKNHKNEQEKLPLDDIMKTVRSNIHADPIWIHFMEEMISLLDNGKSPYLQELNFWDHQYSKDFQKLLSRLSSSAGAFVTSSRRNIFERLILTEHKQRLSNTINSLKKDLFATTAPGSSHNDDEWRRLGHELLKLNKQLCLLEEKIKRTQQ